MKDVYGHAVYIKDREAWFDKFEAVYSHKAEIRSWFSAINCQSYTGVEGSDWYRDHNQTLYKTHEPSLSKVICPLLHKPGTDKFDFISV